MDSSSLSVNESHLNTLCIYFQEVGEKMNPSLQVLRQLLPIAKRTSDVIACTQMGLLTDMKGNKINFDSNEKQVCFGCSILTD